MKLKEKLKKIFTWPDIVTDIFIVVSSGYALFFGLNENQYAYWICLFMLIASAMCVPYDIKQALIGKKDYYIYDEDESDKQSPESENT